MPVTDPKFEGRYLPDTSEGTTAMQTLVASAVNLTPIRRAGPSARASHDAVLLDRVASGDKAAMHVLFSNHHVHVFRYVLRHLRNRALAEDVTSEVFLDVWRCADRFEGRSSVSTWILAIARHKAFSARPRPNHVQLDEEAFEAIEDAAYDPDATLRAQDRGGILRKCLAGLSPDHREIIDLVYYQEQSIASVARILGIPRNTAKTRVFYARRQLSEGLKKAGVDCTSI
jgi:RNA polymerase sigma-70 factor (ECF subfamily)